VSVGTREGLVQRIVRAFVSIPRWIAWRIQNVAYVENL